MEEKKVNHTELEQNAPETQAQTTELSAADKLMQRLKERNNSLIEDTTSTVKTSEDETIKTIVEPVEVEISAQPTIISEEVKVVENIVTIEKEDDVNKEVPKTQKIEKHTSEHVIITSDIEEKEDDAHENLTIPDFTVMIREEMLVKMSEYAASDNPLAYNKAVQLLKSAYYTKLNEEKAEARNKFVEEGGDLKEYNPEPDSNETTFAEAFKDYMAKKSVEQEKRDKEMQANLAAKLKVIETIENLVNKPEAFGETYKEFQELQSKWGAIGLVPKTEQKNLWDEYNRVREAFFAYVKINKELRDLDLKKNLEEKIKLCEQAEELLLEPKITKAQRKLQALHELWRETGPVVYEKKEEIWERFSTVTKQINAKFSEHMEAVREQQEKNLEAKLFLCEQAEELGTTEYPTRKEWKDASDKIVKMQSLWKGIGFVPQKNNNEVYDRFRAACDKFFGRIRAFYDEADSEREKNMQLKTELCLQAESMVESSEWRKTSDFYIKLQEEWKKIGPVPTKHSDKLWKRFRKACNLFFENKKTHFSSRESEEQINLKKKEEIIELIKSVDTSKGKQEAVSLLKDYQKQWTEVGYVPFDKKDTIYKVYREALDEKFGEMKMETTRVSESDFDERVGMIRNANNSDDLAHTEIGKLRNKIDRLEADIQLWENNIGFFANTKNAEVMLRDFNKKIEDSKSQVAQYRKQIKQLSEIK